MQDDFRNKRKSVNHNLVDTDNAFIHQITGLFKERTAILSPCHLYYLRFTKLCQVFLITAVHGSSISRNF